MMKHPQKKVLCAEIFFRVASTIALCVQPSDKLKTTIALCKRVVVTVSVSLSDPVCCCFFNENMMNGGGIVGTSELAHNSIDFRKLTLQIFTRENEFS